MVSSSGPVSSSDAKRVGRDAALTVTLYGAHDVIGQAIRDELERRGCRTHSVSVKAGWLPSATNAIVRLDTAAGSSALEALNATERSGVHVVATCATPAHEPATERLERMCEECSTSHEVALIWHEPVDTLPFEDEPGSEVPDLPVRHLAAAVVDEVTGQAPRSASPSYSTRSVAV